MFTECIPEDLYQYLLNIKLIEDLDDLQTQNWANRRDYGRYVPEVCTSVDIVLTADEDPQIYNDNIFILPISEDLIAESPLNPFNYAPRFYENFDDEFDFLIFVNSRYQFEIQRITITSRSDDSRRPDNATYWSVSNDVQGIGREIFSPSEELGSAGRLQGMIRLPSYRAMAHQSVLLHELMHRWANYIIPSPSGGHWGFSSANGVVGGFDIAYLMDLGGGRYAVRGYWQGGGTFRSSSGPHGYSPIELYVAGLIPAEEVPDLWVGEDVEFVRDQEGRVALAEGRYRVFKPGKVRTYTIEDIIAEHGERVPDVTQSQKDFRAAVILLIDENHPATRWQLDQLSAYIAAFSLPGTDEDGSLNFFEATGGRATITMDGLSQFLKNDQWVWAQPSPETVREALVALYNATDGPNWVNNGKWLSDAPIGKWHGVIAGVGGRVFGLDLNGNRLRGEIPGELGNLANLQRLSLYENQLSGEIPEELGDLANLEGLYLSENQLSGEIPGELGNLANLRDLALNGNQLSGEIPGELGNLANLQVLDLRGNQLSGEIPGQLGSLVNLESLDLRGNQLSGEIPEELGSLANLKVLRLARNQLTGCIPEALKDIPNNDLSGLGLPFC